MKKGAALLAGVLAAAAVLSGCGGQGNNGSTTSADSAAEYNGGKSESFRGKGNDQSFIVEYR